ncbi:MAG: hypothetical protein AB8D78_04300 [Akkermansiaceae bacterium]
MNPKDIFLYLLGNRNSIERVAATPKAWIVGAILVLTAGIARNYDHLDLVRQFEWFIGPFAASIFSALFIYGWTCFFLRPGSLGKHRNQFPIFVNLFWLTAPCAWVYGIPVESFTDIVTATKWNIGFLAVVSIWRIAVIVRAISILGNIVWYRVLPVILAPASIEMFFGSNFKRLSLIGIMGGVRLPPESQLLLKATEFTQVVSFWIFIGSLIACFLTKGRMDTPFSRRRVPIPYPTIVVATISLISWLALAISYPYWGF